MWSVSDQGPLLVQYLVVEGPSIANCHLKLFSAALRAFRKGDEDAPATEQDIKEAWTRAARGSRPSLEYELLGDARQALRTGYPARAVLEAAMAFEVALTAACKAAPVPAPDLKKARGIEDKAKLLAAKRNLDRPSTTDDGAFPGINDLRRARNAIAHEGTLPSKYDASVVFSNACKLVQAFSPHDWKAPA